MIDLLDCLKIFLSWPVEVQQACIYQSQNRANAESTALQNGRTEQYRITRPANQKKRWTDDELLELFADFDRHGWNMHRAELLAKKFGRNASAIRAVYDHHYQDYLKNQNGKS